MLIAGNAQAAITATVDRNRVALGDSLRLTITSDGDQNVSELPLAPLQDDFEILRRSTSSSMNIINGTRTHTRQLLIDLLPRREGQLTIPSLSVDNTSTPAIVVQVAAAADPGEADYSDPVVFEAELDRDSVYVQGQLLLTLRVQVAVSLDSPSITELKLDSAFVKQLEQKTYQRTLDGRSWRVHEIRYAIFPEQSGVLEIPSQTFAARESIPRRSLFDRGGGRHLRRTTEALTVDVLARPQGYPAGTWLPAGELQLEEQWSTPPDQLRAGESTTRTVRIIGDGLQGAQLPPVLFPPVDGLKYYPDQPVIEDREGPGGLVGIRQDSAALVPTRAGRLLIPELRIPWWDTRVKQLRYAVLPGRDITIRPGESRPDTSAVTSAPTGFPAEKPVTDIAETIGATGDSTLWQAIAAISALGWLLTAAWLVRVKRKPASAAPDMADNPTETAAYKSLLAACASGESASARKHLVAWCAASHPDRSVYSLDQVQALFCDPALDRAVNELNRFLYAATGAQWQGTELAAAVRQLRHQRRKSAPAPAAPLALYPDGI
jgi:hypothetical protein